MIFHSTVCFGQWQLLLLRHVTCVCVCVICQKEKQVNKRLRGFSLRTIRATWYLYLDTHLILLLMYLCEALSQYATIVPAQQL